MQERTIACDLTTLDTLNETLQPNMESLLHNEQTFLCQLKQQTNTGLQSSCNPNHISEVVNQQLEPQLDTMLLSNFENYQNILEEKIMSATQNLLQNANSQQISNNGQATFFVPLNSEQAQQNLINSQKDPIQQAINQLRFVRQGQLQTEIQSKLNQNLDLPKEIIHPQIQEAEEQTLELGVNVMPIPQIPQNDFNKQQQLSFSSHIIHEMPLENSEARIQQSRIENLIEKPAKCLQFQGVSQVEKSQYSLNSDKLLGMIQDRITNTQARTEFMFRNQLQNEFDFSEQAQIRFQEAPKETKQLFNQEQQKFQNFETSMMQIHHKSLEENNSSLQVHFNSDSKNNIYQERNQLSSFQSKIENVYQDFQRQNCLEKEDVFYQNATSEHHQCKQQEVNMSIPLAENQQTNRLETPLIGLDIEVSLPQVEKKSQKLQSKCKSQFWLEPHHRSEKEQEKIVNLQPFSQQEYQPSVINHFQHAIQTTGEQFSIREYTNQSPLIMVQQQPIPQDHKIIFETSDKINVQREVQDIQAQQNYTEIHIAKNAQNQAIILQEGIEIESKGQVGFPNSVPAQQHQQPQNQIMENIAFETPYVNITNKSNTRYQERTQLINPNTEMIFESNLNVSKAKSEVQPSHQSIKIHNPKSSESIQEGNKVRRVRKDEQKSNGPSINIFNSYNNTQGQKQIQTEQLQYIPNNFDSFSNMQPFISININKNNEISLNLFRTFSNFQNNLENRSNVRDSEKMQQDSAQNLNFITNNASRQTQRDIKSIQVQKKQLQETAIQANLDEDNYFGMNGNKKIVSQKQTQIQQNSINQSQQESLSQKLNRIRKISDYYMLSGFISQQVHKQFEQILKNHVLIRFSPEPIDDLGKEIFKDGLIMVAMVKMLSRSCKSPFIQSYIYQYLQSAFTIQSNNYLFIQESNKAKKNFQKFLADNHQKRLKQEQMREQQPVRRRGQAINLQRKLTLQSNNIAINEKVYFETRRKQTNLMIHSPVEKIQVAAVNLQKERIPTQADNLVKNINQTNNTKRAVIEKKSTVSLGQIPQKNNAIVDLEQKKKKENEQTAPKNRPQKKVQRVPIVMQEESPTNSLQENDDTNLKSNQDFQNETHLAQSPNEEKYCKIQKANKSKYADLKLNSFQKNECAKKVEACLQNRNSKFNQLYQKYKKIRETKTNEADIIPSIPSEEKVVSITKPVIVQSKEKDSVGEKKRSKHVQFIEEPLQLKKEDVEIEAQDDEMKNKKRRRSKKPDNSTNEEQDETSKIKKSKK